MSTTSLEETAVTAPAEDAPTPPVHPADPDVKTFRGRTLEELLPQIREQLGPEAIVVRQRDGLMGGVGGFFQQRFVEVDAKAGHPRVDVYDEEPSPPESFAALLADAEEADADPIVTAAFAPPAIEPAAPAEPAPPATDVDRAGGVAEDDSATPLAESPRATTGPARHGARPGNAEPLAAELRAAGMSATFAARLIAEAEAHELPFLHGDLRAAVRRALARRIPTALPHRAGGLAVAFAGPGSTACADALARAYSGAGRRAHAVATLDQARMHLERGTPDVVLAFGVPPIASERAEVAVLADRLRTIELDELLAVLPAELDLLSARALHERLAPLSLTGFALACETPQAPLGAALELACTTRLPLAYLLDASGTARAAIAPADPTTLAERLLP